METREQLFKRKEILEKIIAFENHQNSITKIKIPMEEIKKKFIEVLKKAYMDNFDLILDFGIENYGLSQGSLPRNIITTTQLCGYLFDKIKFMNDSQKWIKFIENFNNQQFESIYSEYQDFFIQ